MVVFFCCADMWFDHCGVKLNFLFNQLISVNKTINKMRHEIDVSLSYIEINISKRLRLRWMSSQLANNLVLLTLVSLHSGLFWYKKSFASAWKKNTQKFVLFFYNEIPGTRFYKSHVSIVLKIQNYFFFL